MLVGRRRAGGRGLVVAGLAFIVPAATVVLALAWLYVKYGATPTGAALLYGVKPVLIVIVIAALVSFGRVTLTAPLRIIVAGSVAVLWVAGVNELVLLAGECRRGRRAAARDIAAVGSPRDRRPCRGDRRIGQSRHSRGGLPQGRRAAVRIRLCPARVSSGRSGGTPRLADGCTASRCGGRRPGHARTAVDNRDIHRIRRCRRSGGDRRDGGDLPARLRAGGSWLPHWSIASAIDR